jgi:restriction endonuclease Mrr
MKYDPNNPLSDEELDKIAKEDFDKFLDYLDSKTEYLKSKTRPLNTYELKKFASMAAANEGRQITDKELEFAKKIGKKNEVESFDKEQHKEWKEKEQDVLKKNGVKNVKTDRSQWFD